jgi:iron complex outermembrane receptor protein
LTADTLTRSNITQLIDMNGFVPGLTVANSGSFVRVVRSAASAMRPQTT